MRNIEYNREMALSYAKRWAFGRNPAYYNFDLIGGDCTNFVSQCIYAGAGVMNYTPVFGWYYILPSDRTASWTGVEFLYKFLLENDSVGPYTNSDFIYITSYDDKIINSYIERGDIVQLGIGERFYHSLFITKTEPEILVASHSYDAYNRPLSSYVYERARFIHIDGVRIN